MQYAKHIFEGTRSKLAHFFGKRNKARLKVGILGTGKIGIDLLVKVQRSPWLECVMVSGRNLQSEGMVYAKKIGVPVSDQGIEAFLNPALKCDLVFDATSAENHLVHAPIFNRLGIIAVDMTPSQIGECCVPALGLQDIRQHKNISMISCGGQSSIPVANVLANTIPSIASIEVRSIVSANSIGPGTIANIKEYYQNTKAGLEKFTGVQNLAVDLQVDSVNLETKMLTSIIAHTDFTDVTQLKAPLAAMLKRVQKYVPGYQLVAEPVCENGTVRVDISVEGVGDYLPKYAGNLDIINCAAIAVAEEFAMEHETAAKEHKDAVPLFMFTGNRSYT